jgi:hypothetical protein
MINDAWTSERVEDSVSLTHNKTSETVMINMKDINNITEDILQNLFNDTLSDKDIMLVFRLLFSYVRNR